MFVTPASCHRARGEIDPMQHRAALLVATLAVVLATVAPATVAPTTAGATPARATLKAVPVAKGLNGPSGFTFGPDGSIWYLERATGEVHRLVPSTGTDHVVKTIGGVDGSGERGALGIALHPDWPRVKLVYVYVTRSQAGHLQNQLVRFRMTNGSAGPIRVLLHAPASASPYHNGGRILFGPDRKLYVMIGDGHDSPNAQDRTHNLRGKILRVNFDGTAARGNPYGRIWSFGHRNSFGFAFDPHTGRLWETENGPECTDEINLIAKGGNFGWGPNESCSLPKPAGTNNSGPAPRHLPKAYFASTIGITGAAFCVQCGLGASVDGDLVFGDVNTGSIRAVDLNAARTAFDAKPRVLLGLSTQVHSVEVGPHHRLYFSGPTGIWRLVGV
jgi:glucose/arabinose dehydrogenase